METQYAVNDYGRLHPLTDRQKEVLGYIVEYQRAHGFPPTIRELMTKMHVTTVNGVLVTLKAIEKKGAIKRLSHSARGIQVIGAKATHQVSNGLPSITERAADAFEVRMRRHWWTEWDAEYGWVVSDGRPGWLRRDQKVSGVRENFFCGDDPDSPLLEADLFFRDLGK